jgi:hypothetical protein
MPVGANGIYADSGAGHHVNGVEEWLIPVPETIDAEILGVESFLSGNGNDNGFLGTFSITQIDDHSSLKRSLSHLWHLLLPKETKSEEFQLPRGYETSADSWKCPALGYFFFTTRVTIRSARPMAWPRKVPTASPTFLA